MILSLTRVHFIIAYPERWRGWPCETLATLSVKKEGANSCFGSPEKDKSGIHQDLF